MKTITQNEFKNEVAPQSETEINRQCVKYAESLGFDAYRMNSGRVKVKGGWFYGQKKSTPDYLFNVHGCFVWFEGKKKDCKAEEHQSKRHQELKERGDYVICTDGYDEFIKHFDVVVRLCKGKRSLANLDKVLSPVIGGLCDCGKKYE